MKSAVLVNSSRPVAAGLLLALLVAAPTVADSLTVVPIAVSGGAAPGEGHFNLFGDIDIDSLRRVVFTASLDTGRTGVYRFRRGRIERIVETGDPAPLDAGNNFFVPMEAAGNAAGLIAFTSTVFFPSRQGVFLYESGSISTLALTGESAPGLPSRVFSAFSQLRLDEAGEAWFVADLAEGVLPAGRGIFRATSSSIEPVIVPGDRFGLREVFEIVQFDVNDSGDVGALAVITDPDLLVQSPFVSEIILWTGGRIHTLASRDLAISGGVDLVRGFAVTFDQVDIDPMARVSFFASTNDFFFGGYWLNSSGRISDNMRIIASGDPAPDPAGPSFLTFGAFGFNQNETLAFHGITTDVGFSGFFVRRNGELSLVALEGQPRPGGIGSWQGFLRAVLNPSDEFVFTDFGGLFQTGVFLGRFLPPVPLILEQLMDRVRDADLPRGEQARLLTLLGRIESALGRGDETRALRMARVLRFSLAAAAGHGVEDLTLDRVDPLLADLIEALGGSGGQPPQLPSPRVFDRFTPGQ